MHQRTILAILNRITESTSKNFIQATTELLNPAVTNDDGPSLATLREDFVYMVFEKVSSMIRYLDR